jgi:hypothetical protein
MTNVASRASEAKGRRSRLARAGLLTLALAAVAALGLLATACGGSSSEGVAQVDTTTTTTDGSTASPDSGSADPAAYSACMRSHGVPKFPDPDSDGRILIDMPRLGIDPESAQFQAAVEACRKLEPPERPPSPAQQAEAREQMLAFAACMRENGVPKFPDPESDGSLMLRRNGPIDLESPQFKEAEKACEELTPGRGPSSSGGTP